MATLAMYWDEVDIYGDPIAGIRIVNAPDEIEVPPEACGFRLGRDNEPWNGAWYFAVPNVPGQALTHFGITYSSTFTGPSPSAVEARGPVNGCAGSAGTYVFVTPLGEFGISGDAPIINGAGSFLADFSDPDDITWLDFAGAEIELEEPGANLEPPELPPEFFEDPPEVGACFLDFEDELVCPFDEDSAGQAPSKASLPKIGGLALMIAQNSYLVPNVAVTKKLSLPSKPVPSGRKIELHCPAELHLTGTFFKAPGMTPATVKYRFRFASGPYSTAFSVLVDDDDANQVFHSVSIPLPKPLGHGFGSGGGVAPASTEFGIYKPIDPIPPDPLPPASSADGFAVEPLPDNEHKGSVRLEVLNAAEGIIASEWTSYHVVCRPASGRPTIVHGLRGAGVTAGQAAVNRWLQEKQADTLVLDGIFGPKTEAAVKAFQTDQSLLPDGIVGPRTWRRLLEYAGRTGGKREPGACY